MSKIIRSDSINSGHVEGEIKDQSRDKRRLLTSPTRFPPMLAAAAADSQKVFVQRADYDLA